MEKTQILFKAPRQIGQASEFVEEHETDPDGARDKQVVLINRLTSQSDKSTRAFLPRESSDDRFGQQIL